MGVVRVWVKISQNRREGGRVLCVCECIGKKREKGCTNNAAKNRQQRGWRNLSDSSALGTYKREKNTQTKQKTLHNFFFLSCLSFSPGA